MEVERRVVVGGLAGGARAGSGGFEGVDVDLGLEGDDAVAEAQGLGSDRAAGGVQRLMEVVGGGFGVAVGPQQVGQALAMQAALGGEGQELDQRLGLAQAPRALLDEAIRGGDRESAQQAHARYGVVHPRFLGGRPYCQLVSVTRPARTKAPAHTWSVFSHAWRRICRPTRA